MVQELNGRPGSLYSEVKLSKSNVSGVVAMDLNLNEQIVRNLPL